MIKNYPNSGNIQIQKIGMTCPKAGSITNKGISMSFLLEVPRVFLLRSTVALSASRHLLYKSLFCYRPANGFLFPC